MVWCRPTVDLARRIQQEGEKKKKKVAICRASAGSGAQEDSTGRSGSHTKAGGEHAA